MGSPLSIAIVGIGGIFPDAQNPKQLWENILANKHSARNMPKSRSDMDIERLYDAEPAKADRVNSRTACLIDDALINLDSSSLNLSKSQLDQLDPMFHVLLIAAKQAYDDAGLKAQDTSNTGVILGNLVLPTHSASAISKDILLNTFAEKLLNKKHNAAEQGNTTPLINRFMAGLPAGVVSNALGLGGDSFTLDAACASSLYAMRLAVDELIAHRADSMVCGGISRPDCLYTQMGFTQLNAVSAKGIPTPFDAAGDGLVVGEGSGIFVLKRLEDALQNNDHIYGVIQGIGISNDMGGKLLAPTSEGQMRAMSEAYRQANWTPSDVDLVECHATGTPLGDLVEFETLQQLWKDQTSDRKCVIGSVKSNIGHLLTAAGSAAMMKTLFALNAKVLPPTANFTKPAEKLHLEQSPFEVLTESKPWLKDTNKPRRAGVSAFGFGGINAHVLVEEWIPEKRKKKRSAKSKANVKRKSAGVPIAIIGIDAHAGPWQDSRQFQHRVLGGLDANPKTPDNWWGVERSQRFRDSGHLWPRGFTISKVEAGIRDFRIPPIEMQEMLPQQLLMLQVAAGAWRNAALDIEDNVDTGVYIGIGLDMNTTNFHIRWMVENQVEQWLSKLGATDALEDKQSYVEELKQAIGPALTANRTMGGLGSVIASRISRELKLGGPSFTISSDDSSGINALKTAVRQLQNNTINTAIAGAVDIASDIRSVLARESLQPYSEKGEVKPFDQHADGTIIGDGAAAFILKRLDDAVRDGDRIYGVIKGIGAATGAKSKAWLASEKAYVNSMQKAYGEANVAPELVGYIDAHGSGYPLEDEMEAKALTSFFKKAKAHKQSKVHEHRSCAVGSAKHELGHTGAAAGMMSVVKACMSLYQEILPGIASSQHILPSFTQKNCQLFLNQQSQYWLHNRADGPRTAAISSFNFSGNCTHVVLQAHETEVSDPYLDAKKHPLGLPAEGLFVCTGKSTQGLVECLDRLKELADEAEQSISMHELAALWWRTDRVDLDAQCKVSIVAQQLSEIHQQIDLISKSLRDDPQQPIGQSSGQPTQDSIANNVGDRIFYSPQPLLKDSQSAAHTKALAFVYPGSGNHYKDMGKQLFTHWPEILRNQHYENQYLKSQYRPDVFWNMDMWDPSVAQTSRQDCEAQIYGQVSLGTAVSDLMCHFNVTPSALIGHSLGETASLFAFHAWTDRDLMLQRVTKSNLFSKELGGDYEVARQKWKLAKKAKVEWSVVIIPKSADEIEVLLKNYPRAYLLIKNTDHECVVGGHEQDITALVKALNCTCVPVQGLTIAHCDLVKKVAKQYREMHLFKTTPPVGITYYSGSKGEPYEVNRESAADSTLGHALHGIDYPKTIRRAYADGARVFVEMGPGSSCTRMIKSILHGKPHIARSVCTESQDAVSQLLRALGQLVAEGARINLDRLYAEAEVPNPVGDKKNSSLLVGVSVGGRPFSPPVPEIPVAPKPIPKQPAEVSAAPPTQTPIHTDNKKNNADMPTADIINFKKSNAPEEATSTQNPQPVNPAPAVPSAPAAAMGSTSSQVVGQQQDRWAEHFYNLNAATVEAHEKYLAFTHSLTQTMTQNIALQMQILSGNTDIATPSAAPHSQPMANPQTTAVPNERDKDALLNKQQCFEFAMGSIAKVFGDKFAEVDHFPTRVRLPDGPLMLVDRVMTIDGEPQSLAPGRIVTEHDVNAGDWYLDHGKMPICITVESGQADLMLSGYLGVDSESKGLARYRLLDAEIAFHRNLPVIGETVVYDIRINKFFLHNNIRFFNFEFDGTIDGELVITMRNGCAGFFTEADLAAGQGLTKTKLNSGPAPGKLDPNWVDLVPMGVESYSDEQIAALRNGDLAACFGPQFANLNLHNPITIPGGQLKLVDRVTHIDPKGGRFGLGIIQAEADIHPDDWFLTCHFVDDMVMPGTLMYECCMHTLRIFLMRMGWVCEAEDVSLEPLLKIDSRLKCRGQVVQSTPSVTYEIIIKELGYDPAPYCIADARMYTSGKYIVDMENMTIQMQGMTLEKLLHIWQPGQAVSLTPEQMHEFKPAIYDNESIMQFAQGDPSKAFGDKYKVFDKQRKIARLPRPPYKFLDRITGVKGEPWVMEAGAATEAQYRVPSDEWYFDADRQDDMPFCVLLEIALQPCGWLAAYVGSALTSDTDLSFRNLGGTGNLYQPVRRDAGILTMTAELTGASSSGGMIIQQFKFSVSNHNGLIYDGKTDFGFFSKQALAQQVGIQGAKLHLPSIDNSSNAMQEDYPTHAPFPDTQMRMLDRVDLYLENDGTHGLGFIRGIKQVDPNEWFFQAHFFEDPVNPGSLGLEAFLQLLKYAAAKRWGVRTNARFTTNVVGEKHVWLYRGQVIPANKKVTVEASITQIDDQNKMLKANGYLSVDNRVIYQMEDFTLKVDEPYL